MEENDTNSNTTTAPQIHPVEVMQNLESKTASNRKLVLGVLLTVLALLLVGGALALGYLWGSNTAKEPTTNSGTQTSTQSTTEAETAPTTETEVTLENATLIKDISQKIAQLYSYGSDSVGVEDFSVIGAYLSPIPSLYGNTFSGDEKLLTVIRALEPSAESVISHNNEYEIAKSLIIQDESYAGARDSSESIDATLRKVTVLDADVIRQAYYDLFGEEPVLKQVGGGSFCSIFYYSSSTNSYILFPPNMCGGTAAGEDVLYMEKITKQGDNIYAYYRAASSSPEIMAANDLLSQAGRASVDGLATQDMESTVEAMKADMQNTPTNYAEYRLVFKKNDKGAYSFVRVEKL